MGKTHLLTLGLLIATVMLTGCSTPDTADTVTNAGIPDGCTSWFDGCNHCTVKDGKAEACTMMYCEKPTEAKCASFENVDEKEDVGTPTEGDTVTSSDSDTTTSVVEIPENCVSWFDGCNNCFVEDGKIGACSKKACAVKEEPKCISTKDDK